MTIPKIDGERWNVGPLKPPETASVSEIEDILRRIRRTVICSDDMAAELTSAVVDEGLEHIVRVVPTHYLPPRSAYIIASSVVEEAGIKPPVLFTRTWLAQWDTEHPR